MFYSRETSATKRLLVARGRARFCAGLYPLLDVETVFIERPRDELSQVSALNGWMIAF